MKRLLIAALMSAEQSKAEFGQFNKWLVPALEAEQHTKQQQKIVTVNHGT